MGKRGPAKCRGCHAPVVFFRSPFTPNLRTFDPTPVTGVHPLAGVKAFPVQGRAAYKPPHLAELLQVQRSCSDTDAAAEVQDMTWHLLHECTTAELDPTTEEETTTP